MLSDEQMTVVCGAGIAGWAPIDRPLGIQPLPDWVKGAHVDWMNGCGNAPTVTLKVAGNVYAWDQQQWAKEGPKMYITRHADGRARVLYHDGAVSEQAVWRVFGGDKPFTYEWIVPKRRSVAETWLDAATREGEENLARVLSLRAADNEAVTFVDGAKVDRADVRLVVKPMRVTTEQSGFGGSGYMLDMVDGMQTLLRGPWHGGAPAGFVEVTTFDAAAAPYAWQRKRDIRRQWHRRGGQAGLYITEDLFLRIMARHCAHVPIARVEHKYGTRLEPYRAEWDQPKAAVFDLEWGRAQRKEPAGEFWRVYWDGSERYCGSLRMPTYGFQEGVTP